MSKSERMSGDSFNPKDMSFEAKFTMDEEGMRGLAKFLKELDDETLDAIFSGKQGLILHDSKRGEVELSHVVRCEGCKYSEPNINGSDTLVICKRLIEPMKWFLDGYCSYGEPKEQEHD